MVPEAIEGALDVFRSSFLYRPIQDHAAQGMSKDYVDGRSVINKHLSNVLIGNI